MFVLLDMGILGLATNPKESHESLACRSWVRSLVRAHHRVVVPEVADYELRSELILGGKARGLRRLDTTIAALRYLPITTGTMRRAAELWASARRRGRPSAVDADLDGDAIIAAQAQLLALTGEAVVVATTNVRHFELFVDARSWQEIGVSEA
jgi:predicted nucleic acid-binding protein